MRTLLLFVMCGALWACGDDTTVSDAGDDGATSSDGAAADAPIGTDSAVGAMCSATNPCEPCTDVGCPWGITCVEGRCQPASCGGAAGGCAVCEACDCPAVACQDGTCVITADRQC